MRFQTITGAFEVRFRYLYQTRIVRGCFQPQQRVVECDVARLTTRGIYDSGATAQVVCDSRRQFVKATGRKLALAKALARLSLQRHVRAEIWFKYLARTRLGVPTALKGARAFQRHAAHRGEPVGFLAYPPFNTLNDEERMHA